VNCPERSGYPGRNPDRYPVCPTCKETYQRKKAEEMGA